jgi:antitoxin PrlF
MALMEIEAAVIERGQTTIPAAIRKLLRVDRRSSVLFRVTESGDVTLAAKPDAAETVDPVIASFLAFVEADMARHPDRLRSVTVEWLRDLENLVSDVEVDLDGQLPEEPD